MALEQETNGVHRSRRTMNARTGGRSERVVRDVIRATLEELSRVGFIAMRVDDVAARAGVNKTTVYRRWPTKVDLVVAAVQNVGGYDRPVSDLGSFRAEILELLHRAVAFARTPEGRALTRLANETTTDPDVERLTRSFRRAASRHRAEIVRRAQARGELSPDIDTDVLLDAIFVPPLMRITRYAEDADVRTLEAFVDLALEGARSRGAAATTPTVP